MPSISGSVRLLESKDAVAIVVNRCFGGFSISIEAAQWMAERGHKKAAAELKEWGKDSQLIRFYREHGRWPDGTKPEETDILEIHAKYRQDAVWYGFGYTDGVNDGYERDDPILVEAVRTLGERANGSCAALEIVFIPVGVDWYIDEYDGSEKVCERHREW